MIHLMNGSTAARVKNSEGTSVLDCDCAYTGVEYLQMCHVHYQEWHEKHERARADHAKGDAR